MELGLIDRLLDDARGSTGRALVLRGTAGMGKSALLGAARQRAGNMTVLCAQGIESESELAFAGLHQLLRGVLAHLPALPPPQADELRSALGLARRGPVDRFLVSVGVLGLLAEAAEERPVLCLVDDAHWLDVASADALVFAARRLLAERIAVLFATRDGDGSRFPGGGLPEHRLPGLDPASAAVLLGESLGTPAPPEVAARLVQATGGSPFALLELRSALSGAELRGAAPLPVPLPLTDDLAGLVLARFRRLPDATRTLLLVAAADDTGSAGTVLAASRHLDVAADALAPAEDSGLVAVVEDRLVFRHPLVRSAILRDAGSADRRAAHRALAGALAADPDRSAWHRAGAAVPPDREAAAGLLATAARARDRGAFDAASAATERAAGLAPVDDRSGHLVRAAVDAWLAGQTGRARELSARARAGATGPLRRELDRLAGTIEFHCGRPAEAFAVLVRAAEQAEDDGEAVRLLAEAAEAASIDGNLAGCREAASIAGRRGPPPDPDDGVLRDLVVGMGAFLAGDRDRATPLLRRVVDAGRSLTGVVPLAQAGRAAWYLGDEGTAQTLFERSVQAARDAGQLGLLPYALNRLAACEVGAGRWGSATAYYEEALELARATGQEEVVGHLLGGLAQLAAFRGDEPALLSLADEFRRVAGPRGLVLLQEQVAWAHGHLRLSEGRTAEALAAMREIGHPAVLAASLVDRVDAAVHAGEAGLARRWVDTWSREVSRRRPACPAPRPTPGRSSPNPRRPSAASPTPAGRARRAAPWTGPGRPSPAGSCAAGTDAGSTPGGRWRRPSRGSARSAPSGGPTGPGASSAPPAGRSGPSSRARTPG